LRSALGVHKRKSHQSKKKLTSGLERGKPYSHNATPKKKQEGLLRRRGGDFYGLKSGVGLPQGSGGAQNLKAGHEEEKLGKETKSQFLKDKAWQPLNQKKKRKTKNGTDQGERRGMGKRWPFEEPGFPVHKNWWKKPQGLLCGWSLPSNET